MSIIGVANIILLGFYPSPIFEICEPDGVPKHGPAEIAEVKHLAVHPVKGQVAHPHLH